MDWPTMQMVLAVAQAAGARTIDITGGAPEMNPHFRVFVGVARQLGMNVIVRTNLTILLEKGYTDLPEFFRGNRVRLVASLPCYLPQNVNRQRGTHVYEGSIEALRGLNAVGYGTRDDLPLDLVYNPLGPSLPPPQETLEADYKRELEQRWSIRFTRLICITNMAIGRFLHDLQRDGRAEQYQQLLREAFNRATVEGLMCRHQIHISWDGTLHDCDFNYALNMPCHPSVPRHIRDFDPRNHDDLRQLRGRPIVTAEHCFGCTAGSGSSCGGAIV